MASNYTCVFCGEPQGAFRVVNLYCAGLYLPSCKRCAREVEKLPVAEQCRRALKLGLIEHPEMLEQLIREEEEKEAVANAAEAHRPACLRCGKKLRFRAVECLDNSPLRDGFFSATFDIQPAVCDNCGKFEFFDPEIVKKDPYLAHLIRVDTGE